MFNQQKVYQSFMNNHHI